MIINILATKDIDYVKLSIININSYHILNANQKFVIYLDEYTNDFMKSCVNKLIKKDLVRYRIINNYNYWQKNKIKIFEDYFLKDDFVIVDADSFWYSIPSIPSEGVTFLNDSHMIGDIPKGFTDFDSVSSLDNRITKYMLHYQIGVLSIPKSSQYNNMLDDWNKLCDEIYYLVDGRDGINRTCEQLSISLLSQMNVIKINQLKFGENGPNNSDIIQSFYWSCISDIRKEQILNIHWI